VVASSKPGTVLSITAPRLPPARHGGRGLRPFTQPAIFEWYSAPTVARVRKASFRGRQLGTGDGVVDHGSQASTCAPRWARTTTVHATGDFRVVGRAHRGARVEGSAPWSPARNRGRCCRSRFPGFHLRATVGAGYDRSRNRRFSSGRPRPPWRVGGRLRSVVASSEPGTVLSITVPRLPPARHGGRGLRPFTQPAIFRVVGRAHRGACAEGSSSWSPARNRGRCCRSRLPDFHLRATVGADYGELRIRRCCIGDDSSKGTRAEGMHYIHGSTTAA